jgi:H+/gluconate symporter-like permease
VSTLSAAGSSGAHDTRLITATSVGIAPRGQRYLEDHHVRIEGSTISPLLELAIGAGSLLLSHVNNAGF